MRFPRSYAHRTVSGVKVTGEALHVRQGSVAGIPLLGPVRVQAVARLGRARRRRVGRASGNLAGGAGRAGGAGIGRLGRLGRSSVHQRHRLKGGRGRLVAIVGGVGLGRASRDLGSAGVARGPGWLGSLAGWASVHKSHLAEVRLGRSHSGAIRRRRGVRRGRFGWASFDLQAAAVAVAAAPGGGRVRRASVHEVHRHVSLGNDIPGGGRHLHAAVVGGGTSFEARLRRVAVDCVAAKAD